MALTAAERQQRRRQNLKEARKTAPDISAQFLSSSFSQFLEQEGLGLSFIGETLDSVGLDTNTPLDADVDAGWREDWGTPNRGSLGRAERMVDGLIDIARTLAELINEFKVREIDAAIAKLESAKPTSKAAHKQALDDAVRLHAIRASLSKQVRHAFHQHTVKGG